VDTFGSAQRLAFLILLAPAVFTLAPAQRSRILYPGQPTHALPLAKANVSTARNTARSARANNSTSGSLPARSSNAANAASTLLIEEQNVESQVDKDSVGQAEAFQATAMDTGTVGSLSIYLDASSASTQLFFGIYSGSSTGHPASLLGQSSSTRLKAGAWNTIQVPPITVIKGGHYWIALLGAQGGQPAFRDRYNADCVSETSSQTDLTSLPATWRTGTDWPHSCPLSAYGLGSPVGVLRASPSSVNFGDVIVGDSSALPVMLTNTGTASLTISAATHTGAGFGMSGLLLPLTLHPGKGTNFSADFAPRVTGTAKGGISLMSNASDPTLVIPLAGAGVKAHSVTLTWTASTSKGVIGYNVYRGVHSGGPYTLLNVALLAGTGYKDSTVQAGQTYYYVAVAVNSHHVESLHSNQAQVVIPFP